MKVATIKTILKYKRILIMKYIKKSVFLSLLSLIFLSACVNEKKVETFKTVEYYKKIKKYEKYEKKSVWL